MEGQLHGEPRAVASAGHPLLAPGDHKPKVEATGLNSKYGLAFAGQRLVVTDAGRNDLGPVRPHGEVNAFDPAGPVVHFGFPGCIARFDR